MPLKTFLKNIFIIFLTLLSTLPVIAQDNLLSKFGNKLSYAKYNLQCENPQWLGDKTQEFACNQDLYILRKTKKASR